MFDGLGREPSGFFTLGEAIALVAYGDPTALNRPDADEADREARLQKADRELCGAIAEGAVTLLGRRGDATGKGRFFDVLHEHVPAKSFLNERRTFLWAWDWAALHCGPGVPWDEWLHRDVKVDDPDWGDLRFPKAALLARFPLRAAEPEPRASVVQWLRSAYATKPQPKYADAIRDCMAGMGATEDEAKAAMKHVKERRRRGRPRANAA